MSAAHRSPRRPLVRVRPAVVQDRDLLRDPPARLLRRHRRRPRRLPRPDREARLPAVARRRRASGCCRCTSRRGATAATTSPTSTSVHSDYGTIDDVRAFIDAAHERGIRVIADLVMNHTSIGLRVVSGGALEPRQPQARLVRLVGRPDALRRGADHLRRHRDLELDVGREGRRLLLASLLSSPARPELRQPRGPRGDARRPALLAGARPGRLSPRRRALPLRARRHELREPRRDARVPASEVRSDRRRRVPRPRPARRGQPVAGRRRRLLRRRRRVPHGLPLPGHAADVHGRCAARRPRRSSRSSPRRRTSPPTASGACSCATTTS